MVHLHSFRALPLVASPSTPSRVIPLPSPPQRASGRRTGQASPSPLGERSLQLIQGSLSGRRVERQSPLLATLHRMSTGALIGLGASLVGLSALALHWQNQWAKSYAQLEASKVLEHRLNESASVLEQHHIGSMRRPGQLLPTSSENLIHLPEPVRATPRRSLPLLAGLAIGQQPHGRSIPSLPAGY
jgi:hypothetical protein